MNYFIKTQIQINFLNTLKYTYINLFELGILNNYLKKIIIQIENLRKT